jgi:hypothetical protein
MPNLLEQQIKRARRAKAAELAALDAHTKAREKALQARKTERAAKLEKRRMVGGAIMDAIESGDITPHQIGAVEEILAKVKDKSSNWPLLFEHFPALSPDKHKPANDPTPTRPEVDFARTGK